MEKNAGLEKTEFGKGHSFQTKNMNFKNLTMTKIVKRGPLGFLKIKFDAKYKKMKRETLIDPSETTKKLGKKSHKAKITRTKNFGQVRDSNPRSSASQTTKNPD